MGFWGEWGFRVARGGCVIRTFLCTLRTFFVRSGHFLHAQDIFCTQRTQRFLRRGRRGLYRWDAEVARGGARVSFGGLLAWGVFLYAQDIF
jgi:hypothetical protein